MIKQWLVLGVAAAVCLGAGGAGAEPSGRYTMSPTDGGFVRLDTQTGAMALCTQKDADWSCRDMPESADAGRQRLEELEKENKALKDEVDRLEDTVAGGNLPGEGAQKPLTMPDEKDVDKAFDYIESMIKKFRERVKKLEDKEGDGTPL